MRRIIRRDLYLIYFHFAIFFVPSKKAARVSADRVGRRREARHSRAHRQFARAAGSERAPRVRSREVRLQRNVRFAPAADERRVEIVSRNGHLTRSTSHFKKNLF